jgi:CheY-like chemotaxis protein
MLLKDKRIFIVEDNLSNRAITQMLLEQFGAKTAIDRWGVETLERLRAFMPVNLILMDLMLPGGITGYDVFDRIRAQAEFAAVPIVALSASDPSTAIPLTQERGFAGFISKPIDFHKFPKQILNVLDGEIVWDAPDRL